MANGTSLDLDINKYKNINFNIERSKLKGEFLSNHESYKLIDEIAQGGAGVIYTAEQPSIPGNLVAVKFLGGDNLLGQNLDDAAKKRYILRFLREIKTTGAQRHKNIIKIHDAGITSNRNLYFVMEYVEGGITLGDICSVRGKLDFDEGLVVLKQVSGALAAAHKNGIYHRDLNLDNILLDFISYTSKLTDFGFAQYTEEANLMLTREQDLKVAGSPYYLSKIQINRPEDPDEYAYADRAVIGGSIPYHLFTGGVPFSSASDPVFIAKRILESRARDLHIRKGLLHRWKTRGINKTIDSVWGDDITRLLDSTDMLAERFSKLLGDVDETAVLRKTKEKTDKAYDQRWEELVGELKNDKYPDNDYDKHYLRRQIINIYKRKGPEMEGRRLLESLSASTDRMLGREVSGLSQRNYLDHKENLKALQGAWRGLEACTLPKQYKNRDYSKLIAERVDEL